MWEIQHLASHKRGISVRSVLMYACAALIAALIFIVAAPQPTHAADASWNGSSIVYGGNTFLGPANPAVVSDLKLPANTTVYSFVDPSTATDRKMHIIYFAPGSDPGNLDKANHRTYTYENPTTFTNPSAPSVVSIDPSTANAATTSCDVEGGLGWIICPISNTLAGWMDTIYDILSGFLTVRPAENSTDSALYRAWSFMLTIANIAFVIAFIVIIYSQLTSFGISNYGIKKLLPRVIIAALLVNLSYLICSLAIDISNVLGYGIQDLFTQMRASLTTNNTGSGDILSWSSVTSFILSGGTMATSGLIIAGTAVASYGIVGALALLLPALATMFVAVLIALVVMAARQAIITILVILAPLAFVAYLLPNTEKWFDRWRGTFMTMLILFPAFSVIFGGSQLAGTVIIQNADSINLIILGMVVQVAPLFITPFLIKFSGSLLGRIAGMVNDPNKGIIDRTRNWTKDRTEGMKAKRMATPAGLNLAKRAGQRMEYNRRRRDGLKSAHTAMADANWANSKAYGDISMINSHAGDIKQAGESTASTRYAEAKLTNSAIKHTADRLSLNAMRNEAAKRALNERFTKDLEENKLVFEGQKMLDYAGGVQGTTGAYRALAKAYSDQSSAHADAIKNASTIIAHGNYTDSTIGQFALGKKDGTKLTITPDIQEAAIAKIAGGGNTGAIIELTEQISMSKGNADMRQALADALMSNSGRPKWITGGVINDLKQDKIVLGADNKPLVGEDRTTQWIINAINGNKFNSAEVLATQDKTYLERIQVVLENKDKSGELSRSALDSLEKQLDLALTNSHFSGRIGDTRDTLQGIRNILKKK